MMGSDGSVKLRRELVRALLMKVGTRQESVRRQVTEQEVVSKAATKSDFDDNFVRRILRNVAEDTRSPLSREQIDGDWKYEMERFDTVDDYVAGLKEDGVDPADL
jgi:GTP cyclohydrolase FolE2